MKSLLTRLLSQTSLQYRDFRFFLSGRFLSVLAHHMLITAISQYVYEQTHRPIDLGYIGLAFFLPKFTLTLVAGHTADRFDRLKIVVICRVLEFLVAVALLLFLIKGGQPLSFLYTLLVLMGVAYAFDGPASQSLVPHLIPASHFSNAVSWNSSIFMMAMVLGPALAGWFYFLGNVISVLLIIVTLRFLCIFLIALVRTRTGRLEPSQLSLTTLMAGLHYVFKKKLLLGILSLDLFAVLLGGAVALMPIYANEILHVGARGLGALRAAPALGGAFMAILLALLPPLKRSGWALLGGVALFGILTILFGLSRNFFLSLGILFALGAADMVSVIIRHVLVQTQTPASMRGRVSAVNLIFIGASNELGEFESGLTAHWFGVVPAVLVGGVGTLAVVGLWTWAFPEIRECRRLDDVNASALAPEAPPA